MRRIFFILGLFLAFLSLPVLADDDGGTESVFNIGAGARAMGMGNGFVGLANDASAIYYNPAGLVSLKSQQITFLHTVLFEETIYDFISYASPYKWGTVGLAGMRIGTSDIGRRGTDYSDLGRFSSSRMQMLLSYSRQVHNKYSAGITFKMAHQSIDSYSAYGFGFDIGGHAKITEKLQAGIQIQDIIGAKMQLINEKEHTPFTIKTGVSYLFMRQDWPFISRVILDLEKTEKRRTKIHAGLEAIHNSGLALRGGYDRNNPTFGIGIKYQDLFFDYAYKFIDHLDNSHRFSLTFDFGLSKEEMALREKEKTNKNYERMMRKARKDTLKEYLKKANRLFDKGNLELALAEYYRADAYAEGRDKRFIQSRINDIQIAFGGMYGQTPESVIDTVFSGGLGIDLVRQAESLYRQGALTSARDMVNMARSYNFESATLDSLEFNINFAINDIVNDNINQASSAFDGGSYIVAYNKYNTVLMYDPANRVGRTGSNLAEKKLDLAQHISLGLDYFNQGKYISAKRTFTTVLRLDPENQTAKEHLNSINELIHQSTSQEDLQSDERVWQKYLDGLESFRRGEYLEAISLWEDVLEVYPNNKNTLENIEQARLRLDK